MPLGKTSLISALLLLLILVSAGCAMRGQRYEHFKTETPIEPQEYLVLGFMGGRESWDNDKRWVRKLALELREMDLNGVHVETVENKKRELALKLIGNAFDRNQDAELDENERESARIILYGHSFGGAAVVKLARQLKHRNIPVLLTVQIDSVGLNDAVIPSNVRKAANLYQSNGIFIEGEPQIRAEDPEKTTIIGNFKYDYSKRDIDISHVAWFKKLFRVAHTKMGHDPEVWARVEKLILNAIEESRRETTDTASSKDPGRVQTSESR